jgi:AraC-like DNA-binding protein
VYFEHLHLEREVVFIQKSGSLSEHDLHLHDILEFHILQDHEAIFRLAHRSYEGAPGDVFLFRPFEPHWNLVKHPDRPIRWISVLFSPSAAKLIPGGEQLLAPFYAVDAASPHIPAHTEYARAIHRLAEEAVKEEALQLSGWRSKQWACLIEILIHTYRHSGLDPAVHDNKPDTNIISVLNDIVSSYHQPIDIERHIERSGLGRTIFYSKFRSLTGLSPVQFIQRLRLQTAAYALANTDRSITDIAYDCGYDSLSYFHLHFKRFTSCSPRQYRNRLQKGEK